MYLAGTASLLYLIGYIIAAARVVDAVAGVEANLAEMMYIDARVKRINELRETKTQEGEPALCSITVFNLKMWSFRITTDKRLSTVFRLPRNKIKLPRLSVHQAAEKQPY